LTQYVAEALTANPSLRAAAARAAAAEARSGIIGGRRWPSLDFSVGGTRTEAPDLTGAMATTDLLNAGSTASWEVDLWGRLAAASEASDLDAAASAADARNAALSVTGQTARAYIDLVAAEERLALAEEDLATRERALAITVRRYEQGILSALSLRTARSQTASARAGQAAAADALLIASRRLQVLLGRYPDGGLRAGDSLPALGALEAAGTPEALLQRPDVVAAQARLLAAGFRLEEARDALRPRLTLTGRASGDGGQFADALDGDQIVRQLIGGLAAPIFQGGALRAEVLVNEAEQEAAAAQYVETVLGAWQEVEAALTADVALAVQEAEFANAAAEAREAQDLAEREYTRGVATIFELIDAYSRRIDAERALIGARNERLSNRISFYIALGLDGLGDTPAEEAGQ
jgi:NodT family efflux transporter outer membrane factor (OMF) lipoprotein